MNINADESVVLDQILQRLKKDNASASTIQTFCAQVSHVFHHTSPFINQSEIQNPPHILDATTLPWTTNLPAHLLNKTAVFKLNGGLGTSMGLSCAKSLLPVRGKLSFLDIITSQIVNLRLKASANIPIIFMNSFSTESDTLNHLSLYPSLEAGQNTIPMSFLQSRVPKLSAHTLLPVHYAPDNSLEWCPPGHGDFYTALRGSGLLEKLISSGYEYAFVSNADNLGATLECSLLTYFAEHQVPFMMEVTDRTAADSKGGHLAALKNGTLILREAAQCPPHQMEDFQNVEKFNLFNTNNLWLNLHSLQKAFTAFKGVLPLPIIANRKNVNPKDTTSECVIQLETAMGSAISIFQGALAIRVPRTRFAPVKTTNDLLALQSDLYCLTDEFHVTANEKRTLPPITIDLSPSHYRFVEDYKTHFPQGAPSLLECEKLRIEGNYVFERNVSLQGNIILPPTSGVEIIRAGTHLSD